jgi:MFS family permease
MGAFEALRYRDYRIIWIGSILSNSGTWMQFVGLSWYVLELTGSVFWVGAVNFVNFAPAWLSPIAGAMADRFDRRRILMVTQSTSMVASLALGTLVVTGTGSIWPVMAVTLLSGLAFAADAPARHAFFPSLVPREKMVNAIALNSAQFSLARVVGPAIAGPLVATVGAGPVFWINAVSYLFVLGALAAVPSRFRPTPPEERTPVRVRDGLAYAWRHPVIRPLLVSIAVASLFAAPISTLLPQFSKEVFGRGARGFGFLTAAMGTGSVLGAMLLGRFGRLSPRRIGVALATAGISLIVFAAVGLFGVGMATMLVFGMAYLYTISATNGQLQTTSDDAFRGRVLALFMVAFGGIFPLGSLIGGAVADRIGVQATTIAGASACLLWGLGMVVRTYPRELIRGMPGRLAARTREAVEAARADRP